MAEQVTGETLTAIVPAYNEAETVAATVRSLREQTLAPSRIVVVDDCSTDATAEVASRAGASVVRPPVNTGSKAGAQTFALAEIDTEFVLAVDADTTLEPARSSAWPPPSRLMTSPPRRAACSRAVYAASGSAAATPNTCSHSDSSSASRTSSASR